MGIRRRGLYQKGGGGEEGKITGYSGGWQFKLRIKGGGG